jgi:hypothetical protein
MVMLYKHSNGPSGFIKSRTSLDQLITVNVKVWCRGGDGVPSVYYIIKCGWFPSMCSVSSVWLFFYVLCGFNILT